MLSFIQDPNRKDPAGQTALHKASMNGWLDSVTYLLGKGAQANIQDVSGGNSLTYVPCNLGQAGSKGKGRV